MWLVIKRIIGVLCLLIGLLALVTPLTPGSWLALVGIELLGLTFLLPKKIRDPWDAMRDRLLISLRLKKKNDDASDEKRESET